MNEDHDNFVSIRLYDTGRVKMINKDYEGNHKDLEMMSYLHNVVLPWYRKKERRYERKLRVKRSIREFKARLKNIVGIKTPSQKTKDTVNVLHNWWEKEV